MALEIGHLLHQRYRIEKTIAAGGMGAVYRALDESLNIAVAVKENFFSTDEYSRQFRREATILASLRHANLPRVTDHFVIPQQGQYLVMDFIEGSDLRDLLSDRDTLSEEDVARIGVAIADALAYLHSRTPAVVHRDIKPGNIKITTRGQVYLVDFGLAKLGHGEVTMTGAQGLTPGYAPPEQYGQGTEPRSDIYALGATLYAALTGKIPADGLSRAMGSAELTPIRKQNPQVSEGLARVIERAMAVQVSERYASAEDFKEALLQAAPNAHSGRAAGLVDIQPAPKPDTTPAAEPQSPQQQPLDDHDDVSATRVAVRREPANTHTADAPPITPAQTPVPQAGPQRRFPLAAVLGIGALILLGVLAVVFGLPALNQGGPRAGQGEGTPSPQAAAATLVLAAEATATSQPVMPASETPAPTQTATHTPAPTLTVAAATATTAPPTATPTQTPTPTGGGGGQIAFSSDRGGSVQVWVMDADGGSLRMVTNLVDGACQPDWSPDGQRLVFVSPCLENKEEYKGSSLFLINVDGTGLVPLGSVPGGDYDPAWSPDGSQIAFTSIRDGISHIFVYNLADHGVRRLSRAVNHERRPAWSMDGSRIAYETTRPGQSQIWSMTPDGEDARELSKLEGGVEFMPAWSADGGTIIYTQGTNLPLLVARQVGNPTALEFPISERVRPVADARFSPDDWWIVFTSRQDNNTDIYRMTRSGGSLTRLTDSPGLDFHPAWRPASK